MDPVKPIGPKTKITEHPQLESARMRRPPAMASLGTVYRGAAPPHPDLSDALTAEAGVRKRFVMEPPEPNKALLAELQVFVRKYVQSNFTPLAPDSDLSLDRWLEHTAYPEWRKKELRECWSEFDGDIFQSKYTVVKSFIKDEWYPSYKHARGINARTDTFKCWFGPVVKLMEEEVYKNPHFIKHVPVNKRPQYITELLYREGATYLATDYSSFEALFKSMIMQAVEFELYRWLCKDLPIFSEIDRVLNEVLSGENICEFKWFVVRVMARRMSGEMTTSLGNGFSNLMFNLFMCEKVGFRNVTGVVEGDDGLFVGDGIPPTTEDFEKLGLIIKLEVHTNLAHASFCGIIFEPGDDVNIRDPIEVIVGFGWGDAKYNLSRDRKKQTILRCKALSYAHQYPGCPIIQSLAHCALRNTRHVRGETLRYIKRAKTTDEWHRRKIIEAIADEANIKTRHVPMATRLLMEEKFKVTVEDQIKIEQFYDSCSSLDAYDIPCVDRYLHWSWVHYWDNYVHRRSPQPDHPVVTWGTLEGWKPEFETKFVT